MSTDRCEDCRSEAITMVEICGVYDGGLFYECLDCELRWHRWPEGHPLRDKAAPYVEGGQHR